MIDQTASSGEWMIWRRCACGLFILLSRDAEDSCSANIYICSRMWGVRITTCKSGKTIQHSSSRENSPRHQGWQDHCPELTMENILNPLNHFHPCYLIKHERMKNKTFQKLLNQSVCPGSWSWSAAPLLCVCDIILFMPWQLSLWRVWKLECHSLLNASIIK